MTAAAADPNTRRLIPLIGAVKDKIEARLKPPKPPASLQSATQAPPPTTSSTSDDAVDECDVEVEIVGTDKKKDKK